MTLQHGSERVDVPYLWPTTLALPERPPKLAYLDLNHWVELSKALAGHRDDARYADVLTVFLDAVDNGVAAFPLSGLTSTHELEAMLDRLE